MPTGTRYALLLVDPGEKVLVGEVEEAERKAGKAVDDWLNVHVCDRCRLDGGCQHKRDREAAGQDALMTMSSVVLGKTVPH